MNFSKPSANHPPASALSIDFAQCHQWRQSKDRIEHESGRFFSVVCVRHDHRETIMINQPEVGILGFLLTPEHCHRKWLMQNKPEPGNVGYHQLAPTVQSTKSNYERVHGGASTPFLDYFLGEKQRFVDVECSEQGDRFWKKFNRNAKVMVPLAFDLAEAAGVYSWMTTEELKVCLRKSFVVNTDARSVLSTGAWHLLAAEPGQLFPGGGGLDGELSQALSQSARELSQERLACARLLLHDICRAYPVEGSMVAWSSMRQHGINQKGIYKADGSRVLAYFQVNIPGREVENWRQPLIVQEEMQECILFFALRNGRALFRLMAYPEAGFAGRCELGPSLQTGDGPFKTARKTMADHARNLEVLAQIDQSDEGGRFFRNVSRYTLALWKGDEKDLDATAGIWLSAAELEYLSLEKGVITNELRTLLSLLLSFA